MLRSQWRSRGPSGGVHYLALHEMSLTYCAAREVADLRPQMKKVGSGILIRRVLTSSFLELD